MAEKKPSSTEDEYFAREQAEKLRKLAAEKRKQMAEDEAEALKQKHWMHCPKCGQEMGQIAFRGVELERCFNCGYTGLDQGELEKIVEEEGGKITRSVLNWFKGH